MTLFVSFLLCATLASVVFKPAAKGLAHASNLGVRALLGMRQASHVETARRHPRLVACWDYFQSVTIGAVYSLVISGLRWTFVDMGGASWLYSLAALSWAMTSGLGFKTNPGSVFFTCFFGVAFNLLFWPWGSLFAWILFLLILIPMFLSRIQVFTEQFEKPDGNDPVIIDVDAK